MSHPELVQEKKKRARSKMAILERIQLPENLSVNYDATSQVLYVKWQGKVKTRDLKYGYVYILRMVQFFKPNKWILDLQNRDIILKEDQQWVFKHVFPKVLRMLNQDVFIGVVLPVYLYESLVHDLNGDDLIYEDKVLLLQHFLYYEEALRWLNGQDASSERA